MRRIVDKYRLAICQIRNSYDKTDTLQNCYKSIEEAAQNGAQIIVLGELFNSLCHKTELRKNSESYHDITKSPTLQMMSELSQKHNIYIAGGVPEVDKNHYYNSFAFFGRQGELLDKYRKLHLYDLCIPGKLTFYESDIFCHGNLGVKVVDTDLGKFGLGICYDLRFPEFAIAMSKMGADVMLYAGNFPADVTGPIHWELLLKARALDNLNYVVGARVRRYIEDPEAYQAYGFSSVIDPMGEVVAQADENEGIIYHEIDINKIKRTRESIPVHYQKKNSIYDIGMINQH